MVFTSVISFSVCLQPSVPYLPSLFLFPSHILKASDIHRVATEKYNNTVKKQTFPSCQTIKKKKGKKLSCYLQSPAADLIVRDKEETFEMELRVSHAWKKGSKRQVVHMGRRKG